VDLTGLGQDKDEWRGLVDTIMNLPVPKNCWETMECLHNWWHPEYCLVP
jgi:hypothetical protein